MTTLLFLLARPFERRPAVGQPASSRLDAKGGRGRCPDRCVQHPCCFDGRRIDLGDAHVARPRGSPRWAPQVAAAERVAPGPTIPVAPIGRSAHSSSRGGRRWRWRWRWRWRCWDRSGRLAPLPVGRAGGSAVRFLRLASRRSPGDGVRRRVPSAARPPAAHARAAAAAARALR